MQLKLLNLKYFYLLLYKLKPTYLFKWNLFISLKHIYSYSVCFIYLLTTQIEPPLSNILCYRGLASQRPLPSLTRPPKPYPTPPPPPLPKLLPNLIPNLNRSSGPSATCCLDSAHSCRTCWADSWAATIIITKTADAKTADAVAASKPALSRL